MGSEIHIRNPAVVGCSAMSTLTSPPAALRPPEFATDRRYAARHSAARRHVARGAAPVARAPRASRPARSAPHTRRASGAVPARRPACPGCRRAAAWADAAAAGRCRRLGRSHAGHPGTLAICASPEGCAPAGGRADDLISALRNVAGTAGPVRVGPHELAGPERWGPILIQRWQ